MFLILEKEHLTPVLHRFIVQAPEVARKGQPGQFVIIRLDEKGERIPLTIADSDADAGTLTLVVQEVGASTKAMATYEVGDSILDLVGPLGKPSEIEAFGMVVCAAGGVGIAPIYPITRALKKAGNTVISIIGARNQELLFWEEEMRAVSDELIVCTDDGSYGRFALVPQPLQEMLEAGRQIDRVITIGPAIMMKFVCKATEPFTVPTIVSINSIMVDGTGMCGACRVSVGGHTRFACVDGPDFDGHQVDWDLLLERQRSYLREEKTALEEWERHHPCEPGLEPRIVA